MNDWKIVEWGAAVATLWWLWLRPKQFRDFYVLERCYYNRHPAPHWRGTIYARHVDGFDDFLAARAAFDFHEEYAITVLDTAEQEAEHSIHVIAGNSREDAVKKIKDKKLGGRLVHKTPWSSINRRRAYWDEEAKARVTRSDETP